MYTKRVEELVDIAMSFFDGVNFEHEKFERQLKKLGYTFDRAAGYIASQLENIGKFPQSCMFIDSDKDFGSKGCPFYRTLKQGDSHFTVCTGQYTVKQRWSGGGPYSVDKKLVANRIPSQCQGPFKSFFTERLKKAMEGYLFAETRHPNTS